MKQSTDQSSWAFWADDTKVVKIQWKYDTSKMWYAAIKHTDLGQWKQECHNGHSRDVVSVSRRSQDVFGTSRIVSVLKVERLGLKSLEKSNVSVSSRSWGFNVSVSSRSWEFEKMEHLGLVSVLKVDRLGLVSVLWHNVLFTSLGFRPLYSSFIHCEGGISRDIHVANSTAKANSLIFVAWPFDLRATMHRPLAATKRRKRYVIN